MNSREIKISKFIPETIIYDSDKNEYSTAIKNVYNSNYYYMTGTYKDNNLLKKKANIDIWGYGDCGYEIRSILKNEMDKDLFLKRSHKQIWGIINSIESGKYPNNLKDQIYFRGEIKEKVKDFDTLLSFVGLYLVVNDNQRYSTKNINDINWVIDYDDDNIEYYNQNDSWETYIINKINEEMFEHLFSIKFNTIKTIETIYMDGNEELLYFDTEDRHYSIMMYTS